jgi:hypothetical protein
MIPTYSLTDGALIRLSRNPVKDPIPELLWNNRAVWTFSFNNSQVSANAGTSSVTTGTLNNVENFTGTSLDDTFNFSNGALIQGSIDGGAGNNILSYSGYGAGSSIVLDCSWFDHRFSGSATGIAGGFDNISKLTGSIGNADTLTGMNSDSVWTVTIDPENLYNASGRILSFSGFENLNGGNNRDTFSFEDTASHVGSIAGGNGSNLLDYQNYTASIIVNLITGTASCISGYYFWNSKCKWRANHPI